MWVVLDPVDDFAVLNAVDVFAALEVLEVVEEAAVDLLVPSTRTNVTSGVLDSTLTARFGASEAVGESPDPHRPQTTTNLLRSSPPRVVGLPQKLPL